MKPKIATAKSTIFLASLEEATQVFEHVGPTEVQLCAGPTHGKNPYQRWSKNDSDLMLVCLEFEEVRYENGPSSYWMGRIGKNWWTWFSKPIEVLRRCASIARERKALERCVRSPLVRDKAAIRL